MSKQVSDEQIDKLMKTVMRDASPDESMVDEIVDSPTLWWSVQRNIKERSSVSASPLSIIFRRWLTIGIPVAAAIALAFGIFSFRPADEAKTDLAGLQQNGLKQTAEAPVEIIPEPAVPVNRAEKAISVNKEQAKVSDRQIVATTRRADKKVQRTLETSVESNAEIKSEFIALSYAGNPESGQVVRVKVPSSMMVTLGLVQSVEKPSSLIDAEVIVGDDGTNHAIRFIL